MRPPSWLGAALLLFFAHAFFAGATHFHTRADRAAETLAPSAQSLTDEESEGTPDVKGHAQCPLCRVQRSLTADLEGTRAAVAAPSPTVFKFFASSNPIYLDNSALVPAGRAPPTA